MNGIHEEKDRIQDQLPELKTKKMVMKKSKKKTREKMEIPELKDTRRRVIQVKQINCLNCGGIKIWTHLHNS